MKGRDRTLETIPERELVATVIGEVPLLTAEQVAKSLVVNP